MRKVIKKIISLFLIIVALVVFFGCTKERKENLSSDADRNKEVIIIGGSGINTPLLKKLAMAYMEKEPNVYVEVPACLDSPSTIKGVADNNLDLGFIGHELADDERKQGLIDQIYARTLLVFGVNPSLPVSNLSAQNIKDIFSGKITNWQAVGGPDSEIIIIVEEHAECPIRVIDSHISGFASIKLPSRVVRVRDCAALNEGLASVQNSIGWTDLGAIKAENHLIKHLSINGVLPTIANYRDGLYPLARDLYVVSDGNMKPSVKGFMDFILAWEGHKVILDNGYMVP